MTHLYRRIAMFAIILFVAASILPFQTTPPVVLAQDAKTTITVTSTDDSDVSKSHTCYTTPGVGQTAFPDKCTLRRAIVEASSLPESARPVLINFNIPTSDPVYDTTQSIWKIVLNTAKPDGDELPAITGGQVIIDGTTQPGGRTDGPSIFITANDIETVASPSLRLRLGEIAGKDGYTVRGLGLQGFGISMVGSNNTIENNWLGLTDDGTKVWFYRGDNPRFVTRSRNTSGAFVTTPREHAAYYFEGDPEKGNGAEIVDRKGGTNNIIRNNVLAGTNGLAISISSSQSQVTNNYIGTRADGTIPTVDDHRRCKPNALYYNWFSGSGVQLTSDATEIVFKDNVILGMMKYSKDVENTAFDAINVRGNQNSVENNKIGVDATGKEMWVCGQGLDLGGHTQTIKNNTLVDTHGGAVGIYGSATTLDAIHLTGNTMKNSYLGHTLSLPSNPYFGDTVPEAYKTFTSASITSLDGTTVGGTAGANSPCAGCTVEVYADNTDEYIEALELLGTATADSDGAWSTTLSRALQDGEALRTATTTAQDAQISGVDAPTTAKFSPLYGASGIITPTQRVSQTVELKTPPIFPTLEPREVPVTPTKSYTIELTVNTTADPGNKTTICTGNQECSLRAAINEIRTLKTDAGSRPLRIAFNIPESDSGYDAATGTWTIAMKSTERQRIEGGQVTIDGTTQPGGRDSGPKIIISDEYDIVLDGGDNIVHDLAFQGAGLIVNGSFNVVGNNWFGLAADGTSIYYPNNDPSRDNHATIQDGTESSVGTPAIQNVYRNNVLAGSIATAMTIRSNDSWVVGNTIGMLADGTVPALSSDWCTAGSWYGGSGITISGGSGNQIGGTSDAERNYIAGLNYPTSTTADPPRAIVLEGQGGNLVLNNVLGRDTQGNEVGNCGEAFRISDDYAVIRSNTVISHAITAFHQVSPRLGGASNLLTGNILKGNAAAMSYSDAVKNELDLYGFNSARVMKIEGTQVQGISGNDYIDPITGYVVKGLCPFCTVEIFADNTDSTADTLELLATTTADAAGAWTATLTRELSGIEGIRTTSTAGDYGMGIKDYEVATTSKLSRLYTSNVNNGIVEQTIPPDTRQTVVSYDDLVEVQVPAGAVSTTVVLVYTDLTAPTHDLPTGSSLLRALTVVMKELSTSNLISSLGEVITIQVRYSDADLAQAGITESALSARYWDETAAAWKEIAATAACDRCGVSLFEENNILQIKVDHLSEFAVGTFGTTSNGETQIVYLPLVTKEG